MDWQEFSTKLRHVTPVDRERIRSAFQLASDAHAGQKRLSGDPYISHPIAVAQILIGLQADAETIIAALLHDTVEDTPLTLEEIERQFSPIVRRLIEGVTKLSKADLGGKPTLDEQIETLRKIFNLMQEDIRIMVIKLADRLHNMQTSRFLPQDKRTALARETQDVYVKMADRLCMYELAHDLERLCIETLEPDLFSKLAELRRTNEQRGNAIVSDMRRAIAKSHSDTATLILVEHERKRWERLRQQIEREGAAATGMSDLTVVFVCPDVDTCYRTFGVLHQLWKRETLSFQDFINAPQLNGYRGLHTTVILADGTRVRCKIRTKEMHAYAQRGIATVCFRMESRGVLEYLPWTQRISPLSEDTVDRSTDFWQSLQSDVLGESMVIHGPADETVLVPKGATALDGAFYLFKDIALRAQTIKVNGREVPFQTLLKHGDALTVTLDPQPTLQREWLQWTKTGLATAHIRTALTGSSSPAESITTGRSMLQHVMQENRRGFIEEFEETMLIHRLQPMGFNSLQDAYLAIAQGRITAEEVFTALFRPKRHQERRQWATIRYAAPMENMEMMDALNTIHRRQGTQLHDIRYRRGAHGELASVALRGNFTEQELHAFTAELKVAGAMGIHSQFGRMTLQVPSIVCMLLLWGIEPVLSKMFLIQGVHPMSFTVIRTLSIFLFSLFTLQWTLRPLRFSRISLVSPSLWLSGIALFFVSIFTYTALASGTPVLYNTVLRSNAFLVGAPDMLLHGNFFSFITSLAMTAIGFILLRASDVPRLGLLLSILVLLCFSLYTAASRRFQSSARVLARLPQFFSFTSATAAACALVAFFFFPAPLPSLQMTALLSLFSIGFIGTPYLLFYKLTRDIGYTTVSPWNHLLAIVTIIGQWLVFGIDHFLTIATAALFLTIGSIIASRSAFRDEG